MPRPSNTDERRDQIVAGLQRAMAAQGYAGATIRGIAQAAELAPGLIHYHFSDKREILVALVDTLIRRGRERFERRARTATTARERLVAYLDARLARGRDADPDAVAAWVVIGAEAVRDAEVRELYQQALAGERTVLCELLNAFARERRREIAHVNELAAGLLAFIEGAYTLAANARTLVPTGFAARFAWTLVERYIAAEPADA
jgi:TetR/AcrR family transcriptional regulator, transcriptional repressor of bet genes